MGVVGDGVVGDGVVGLGVVGVGVGLGVQQAHKDAGQLGGSLLQFSVHHESVACGEMLWHVR